MKSLLSAATLNILITRLSSCHCEARGAEAISESNSELASLRSQGQFELLNGHYHEKEVMR